MKLTFLVLYSTNIIVKGKAKSAIYVLDRSRLIIIPNTFYLVIKDLERFPYHKVETIYESQANVFKTYIDYLISEDLAFFTEEPELFPKLNLQFNSPETVSAATVFYAGNYSFEKLIEDLDICNCKHLQLLTDNNFSNPRKVIEILEMSRVSALKSINLVLLADKLFTTEVRDKIINTYMKVSSLTFCNAGKTELQMHKNVICLKVEVNQDRYLKDYELKNYLVVSNKYFAESQLANPYYNKKVCIDGSGNIKNSWNQKKHFGNIKNRKLFDVVSSKQFQNLWKLIPQELKESEYRHCLYNPKGKVTISNFCNYETIHQYSGL